MKTLAAAVILGLCSTAAFAADSDGRKAEIKFYTTEYAGDDIAYENVGCGKPAIPDVSQTKAEIKKVAAAFDAWHSCYDAYIERLNALQPVGKALPAGLAEAMTPAELDLAKRRMAKVYEVVAEEASEVAKVVLAENIAWHGKTEAYVMTEDARQKDKRTQLEQLWRNSDQNFFGSKGIASAGGGTGNANGSVTPGR
jgi:hypothetical protein